ncbi:response regulator [Microbacterium luticocti]|uniref:response regulator n=1 Tax=Microbacterium luticocti TaxID=451764 RepID=UPI00048B11B8|nr:response regulator transcription factor [Microbacterium luticocti]
MPEPVRVLLVDDHAMMRAGFRLILETEDDIAVVGEASTGREALTAAHELRPDVICMDVQMPDMDGLEATRRLATDPEVAAAVLIVTTFNRDDYLFDALAAGAAGFLLKNAGPEELVRAVRVAAAGDALLAPEVTRRVIARFARDATGRSGAGLPESGGFAAASPGRSTATPGKAPPVAASDEGPAAKPGEAPAVPGEGPAVPGEAPAARPVPGSDHSPAQLPAVPLTDREAEVLALMAEALSNAEIAGRLYIGEATVKTHVSNVLGKLGARDRVQAIVLAYRHGLV